MILERNSLWEERMKTKIKIIIMIMIITLCSFTGCKKEQKETTTPYTDDPKKTEKPSQTPTPTPTPTEHPMVKGKKELLDGLKEKSFLSDKMESSFIDWVEEQYGTKPLEKVLQSIQDNTYSDSEWLIATKSSLPVLLDTYNGRLQSKETAKENRIYFLDTKEDEDITLGFIGDFSLADNWHMAPFADRQANGIEDCFSHDLLNRMREVDLMMGNNEFQYSDRGKPLKGKAYTFRAATSRVGMLEELGLDVVSLANNHAYDFGQEALLDTLHTLEKQGIPYVGAGKNIEEAMKPVYYIANGIKIGIVSATQIERHSNYTKEATSDKAGVLRTRDDKFIEVIKSARKECDYLIAYIHWGTEYSHQIDAEQKSYGKEMITAGADLIVGAHPHILQGVEYYKGKPIIYSLGNFWFNGKTLDTALLEVTLNQNQLGELKLIPAIQKKKKTKSVEGTEKQKILNLIKSVSYGDVMISKDGVITENEKQ